MGDRTAGEISARLIAEGILSQTLVLVAVNVSRRDEKRWYSTLAMLSEGMAEIDSENPVLLGVGRVFARKTASVEVTNEAQLLSCTVWRRAGPIRFGSIGHTSSRGRKGNARRLGRSPHGGWQ